MADQFLYVAEFTIDGIHHALGGYADSAKIAEEGVRRILASRNATVEEETAELVKLHFRVTPEQKKQIEDAIMAKNPDMATTDARLLQKPQTEVIDFAERDAAEAEAAPEKEAVAGGPAPAHPAGDADAPPHA